MTLKDLLEKKGVTAYQMSKDTGIAESTLSRISSRKRTEIKLKTAITMSAYLNVDVNIIFNMLNDSRVDKV